MLSQKILKPLSLTRITQSSFLQISTSSIALNYNDNVPVNRHPDQFEEKPERKLKVWRKSFRSTETIIPIEVKKDGIFEIFRTKLEFTPWGIKKYLRQVANEKEIASQAYVPERYEMLGPDLSLAYFLIHIGGKVKFKGNDQWVFSDKDEINFDLPYEFEPNYIVEEIDASDCVLYYEGIENFINCPRVKWASFSRSPKIDDWCIDRIARLFPFIKYLDLSDCPKVTERGLTALYKTGMLQTLIVTNNHKSAAFELTCMMLEDVIPGLKIEIREPKEEIKPEINEI